MTTLRELRNDDCDLCLGRTEGRWWSHRTTSSLGPTMLLWLQRLYSIEWQGRWSSIYRRNLKKVAIMCHKILLEGLRRTWKGPVTKLGFLRQARSYFDTLIGIPWTTKKNQRFNYVALNVRKIREIKLENMMQGAIVVFFFFNVLSLHLAGTVEEYHKTHTRSG
jgi:hypothetical protein